MTYNAELVRLARELALREAMSREPGPSERTTGKAKSLPPAPKDAGQPAREAYDSLQEEPSQGGRK